MPTIQLKDKQLIKIRAFLKADPNVYIGKNEADCRRFVAGVLWISQSGSQWRLLPEAYRNWNSLYKRFARWCELGAWARMLQHFANDPDMENGIIDSTVVRAHPCAAGAPRTGCISS